MNKKRIDTTLHYFQYVGARIGLIVVIGFLIYSIRIQRTSAIIFCSLFLLYTLFLLKKVFDRPMKIEFDENYIYLDNGNKTIELNKIIGIKWNRILYQSGEIKEKIKLPTFYFMDKNWIELKKLIRSKNTKHNKT